jgi:hypothetical protein
MGAFEKFSKVINFADVNTLGTDFPFYEIPVDFNGQLVFKVNVIDAFIHTSGNCAVDILCNNVSVDKGLPLDITAKTDSSLADAIKFSASGIVNTLQELKLQFLQGVGTYTAGQMEFFWFLQTNAE